MKIEDEEINDKSGMNDCDMRKGFNNNNKCHQGSIYST
jgi:hypothetical protein